MQLLYIAFAITLISNIVLAIARMRDVKKLLPLIKQNKAKNFEAILEFRLNIIFFVFHIAIVLLLLQISLIRID